ncbi:TetR/AcrR family transcriptional regulator [Spirosoma terrae]|uniref:TetR/AcrR family transcriptional regulator n=1 Tax=Spirosoma terrae TaxID=1968276 RepID=A0A6L9L8J8_9BACT|nr:TetR/AcrR family transcriptional regulator [Spirosoma terrae]NDU95073.1 TetR/AcrR family transcriptional regulator [Spirosoma terrae]
MARTIEFDQEQAIERATRVFWEKGYNGASLRDLTDAMKINSSSLYNTIGDKHELFVQCLNQYTRNRKIALQKRAISATSPVAALTNFIHDVVMAVIEGIDGCLAIKTAFEVSPKDDQIKAILKSDNEFTHHFLTSLIREAVQIGELQNNTNPDLLADYIISTYTGWYEIHLLYRDPAKIKKLAQFMISQVIG